jgi:sec-independent protein translocase protein TatA
MFGLGPFELVLIVLAILIIFGAGKLPQVLGSLGKGVKEFREASDGPGTTTADGTPTATTATSAAPPVSTTAASTTTTAQTVPPAAQNTTVPPEPKA